MRCPICKPYFFFSRLSRLQAVGAKAAAQQPVPFEIKQIAQ